MKPAAPTLTSDVANPFDMDDIVLTCNTTTSGITSYEFTHLGVSLVNKSSNTHEIPMALIDTNDGSYTCRAFYGSVASEQSSVFNLACELLPHSILVCLVCFVFECLSLRVSFYHDRFKL